MADRCRGSIGEDGRAGARFGRVSRASGADGDARARPERRRRQGGGRASTGHVNVSRQERVGRCRREEQFERGDRRKRRGPNVRRRACVERKGAGETTRGPGADRRDRQHAKQRGEQKLDPVAGHAFRTRLAGQTGVGRARKRSKVPDGHVRAAGPIRDPPRPPAVATARAVPRFIYTRRSYARAPIRHKRRANPAGYTKASIHQVGWRNGQIWTMSSKEPAASRAAVRLSEGPVECPHALS